MKKIFFLFSFLFLLFLSSCSKILDQNDKDILLESINNFDNSEVRNYAYKDLNNNLNTIHVSFMDNYYSFSKDDYYSFSLDGNRYEYNTLSNDIYENGLLVDNKEFKDPDSFVKYVFNFYYSNGILLSFYECVPFIKDVFSSNDVNIGRRAHESDYSEAYYYSVVVKEELIIESTFYDKFKELAHKFTESKDDLVTVSIIGSLKDKKIESEIVFSIDNNAILSL
ncbi:MAG: hypothetical protein J5936_05090 [Acholeplasmatales bacterium]|nr:hypothetical protein [Acholeplasmatales bacterium]